MSICVWAYVTDKNAERYTVTFVQADDTVIEQRKVKTGYGTIPPAYETEGVFRGWNTAINCIQSDIEAHPMVYDIVEKNLFYFDSQYVQEGKDFTLGLFLGGDVNLSNAEIELTYDPRMMEYKKANGAESCIISLTEDGTVLMTVDCDCNLSQKTKIADIVFNAKKEDVYSSEIQLSAKNVLCISSDKRISEECATINNKIYYLQEVD